MEVSIEILGRLNEAHCIAVRFDGYAYVDLYGEGKLVWSPSKKDYLLVVYPPHSFHPQFVHHITKVRKVARYV